MSSIPFHRQQPDISPHTPRLWSDQVLADRMWRLLRTHSRVVEIQTFSFLSGLQCKLECDIFAIQTSLGRSDRTCECESFSTPPDILTGRYLLFRIANENHSQFRGWGKNLKIWRGKDKIQHPFKLSKITGAE